MSKRSRFRLGVTVTAMAVAFLATGSMGAEPGVEAARLDAFAHPDGGNYFALSLKPAESVPDAGPHDIVVLFDTSATQVGAYRTQGLSALVSLLGSLSPEDRVHLMAVDVNAIGMTEQFVGPNSPEMADALKKLDQRVPLGATDMERALTAAAAECAEGARKTRAVVYIGDGMSTAHLLGTEEFDQLAGKLADSRISVSSYAIGPRLDLQVLGALAANTGGQLIKDPQIAAEAAGTQLAGAARGAVLWPEKVTWPAAFTEVFPRRTPPLRTDRDSVVIGTYQGEGPFEVQMTVQTGAGSKPLSWNVTPNPPNEVNSYLARLVEAARLDGGTSLPLVGSASLEDADRAFTVGIRQTTKLAIQALRSGDTVSAERLAREALRQDPEDNEARIVLGAVRKGRADGPTGGAGPAPDLNLVGAAPPDAGARAQEPPGGLLDQVQRRERLFSEMITKEVEVAIGQARDRMHREPEAAIQDLKERLENVRRAPGLNPEVRNELVQKLQAAVRDAERRQVEVEKQRQEQYEMIAAAQERNLIAEQLLRNQQKLQQLMEKFNSLMDEGRFRYAEEAVAVEAQQVAPGDPVPALATHFARITGYYHDARALRVARQKGVIDQLYQVEKSHVPSADEPPILYPDAEIWKELSKRRIEKWSAMSLSSEGPAEQRIAAALKQSTVLEFIDTPLSDVVATLKDYHGIEIRLDQRALEDVGIPPDTPITEELRGVSLRSALKEMLSLLDLTYVIRNEMLVITTPEEAELDLTLRVYPVADLVIPVISTGMMGGGMGMMGGMGGMGGMMGGGGMGGGMGGMGGGFFNVPPEKVVKTKVTTVCLEHGKSEPRPAMKYQIKPIEQFTGKPEVRELLRMLGSKMMPQRVAQAAAWHLASDMSWQELASKELRRAFGVRTPYFSRQEIRAAMQVTAAAAKLAKEGQKSDYQDTLSQR